MTYFLNFITSHHITSHHITSHHITSHHITSHHITSHHITNTQGALIMKAAIYLLFSLGISSICFGQQSPQEALNTLDFNLESSSTITIGDRQVDTSLPGFKVLVGFTNTVNDTTDHTGFFELGANVANSANAYAPPANKKFHAVGIRFLTNSTPAGSIYLNLATATSSVGGGSLDSSSVMYGILGDIVSTPTTDACANTGLSIAAILEQSDWVGFEIDFVIRNESTQKYFVACSTGVPVFYQLYGYELDA